MIVGREKETRRHGVVYVLIRKGIFFAAKTSGIFVFLFVFVCFDFLCFIFFCNTC